MEKKLQTIVESFFMLETCVQKALHISKTSWQAKYKSLDTKKS